MFSSHTHGINDHNTYAIYGQEFVVWLYTEYTYFVNKIVLMILALTMSANRVNDHITLQIAKSDFNPT